MKVTKIQELDFQIRTLREECTRLKNLLEQALKKKMTMMIQEQQRVTIERKLFDQINIVNMLMQEKTELNYTIRDLRSHKGNLEQRVVDLEGFYNKHINYI